MIYAEKLSKKSFNSIRANFWANIWANFELAFKLKFNLDSRF